jgi:F0F1-type ATP synthase assembly protein I
MTNDEGSTLMPDSPENKPSPWVQLAKYSELAVIFPATTVVGWLIGTGLDHWLNTRWLYLVGLLLGIAAGFIELIRMVGSSGSQQ